ncbi:hypothetical protein GX865_01500 [Candidatus Saccharibacteria bacterium]|nr:hypothetical protein [Candidatus Saccharibacteria bacterium]
MDGAAGILVVLLSVTLLIFLVLLIFLTILMIRISRQIKHIADDAEKVVGETSSFISGFSQFTKSIVAVKLVREMFNRRNKGGSNVKRK